MLLFLKKNIFSHMSQKYVTPAPLELVAVIALQRVSVWNEGDDSESEGF